MRTLYAFLRNDLGALRIETVVLCVAALALVGMAAVELFDVSANFLISAVDPSSDQTTAGSDVGGPWRHDDTIAESD